MPIDLYGCAESAPARMVHLLATHMGLQINYKTVELSKGEQFKPEFLTINPQHTVPTLVDAGLILTESRAMLTYLQNKYASGRNDSLYPKTPKERAVVDMRLFFDVSTLYARFSEAYYPFLFAGEKELDPERLQALDEALGLTERFLADGFIAGKTLTIADFSVATTLSTIKAFGHDLSKFPKISHYLNKCKSLLKGWAEVNQPGADSFGEMFKQAFAAKAKK